MLIYLFAAAMVAMAIGLAGERSRTIAPMLMSSAGVVLLVLSLNATVLR